jgi:hypothetical protein
VQYSGSHNHPGAQGKAVRIFANQLDGKRAVLIGLEVVQQSGSFIHVVHQNVSMAGVEAGN